MTLTLVVFVVVVVVVVGSFALMHDVDGLDVLSTNAETHTDEALTVLGILVGPGCLKSVLTQVCSLPSALQIQLHELDLLGQTFDDPVEVPMLLEVSGDAPLRHLVGFFVQYLPVCFVGMHGGAVPMGHGFEGFIFVVERGFSVYVHNIWHRVDGGPHGISGDAPVVEVSDPFWRHEIAVFVRDSGIGGAAVVIGLEPVGAGVHVVRYFELLLDTVFKFLDAGSFLVLFSEVFDISLPEGGHQAAYNGSEHVCGEFCKLFSTNLGRAW